MVVKKEVKKSNLVKKGDKVKIEYEGKLEDGTVFDASERHGKPLEFEVGSGQVIKGFDQAVEGMKANEEKEITIKPEEGYGQPNPDLLKKIPREQLPKDQEPQAGMVLALGTPDGRKFPAIITEVNDKEITVDLNHPLAGKTLKFKVKVVE
ncbi:MAG: peptidylprolyl isomerase [Candidatus Woesearchaeota archaeon]